MSKDLLTHLPKIAAFNKLTPTRNVSYVRNDSTSRKKNYSIGRVEDFKRFEILTPSETRTSKTRPSSLETIAQNSVVSCCWDSYRLSNRLYLASYDLPESSSCQVFNVNSALTSCLQWCPRYKKVKFARNLSETKIWSNSSDIFMQISLCVLSRWVWVHVYTFSFPPLSFSLCLNLSLAIKPIIILS